MRERIGKMAKRFAGRVSGLFLARRSRALVGELLEVVGLGCVVAAAWTVTVWAGLLALGVALFAYGVSMDPGRKGKS